MAEYSEVNQRSATRVAVVGMGIVSPLGIGITETATALREGRDCISPVNRFPVDHCRCKTAGQISDARLTCPQTLPLRQERLHRVARMTILALGEALASAPDFQPELSVVGTTSGGMTYGEEYYRGLKGKKISKRKAPSLIANYTPQKPIMDALQAFGFSAPCQVIANACASGTNAIGHAFDCIRSGRYKQILTGGYDALSELVFVGFDSLQASTPERCRPFDQDRTGLVLGEGAAILLLENLQSAKARRAKILAEIVGYGLSTDNHHLTQPNPSGSGPFQAMEGALKSAGLRAENIDYINAHGTATPQNDATEGKAIDELFEGVAVSSTKGMMGHALGAAGAIEAVISILAIQKQFMPANINFRAGDAGLDLNIVANKSQPADLRRVLSNSFGFGGTNASVIFQATEP
jgi:3-oxoacyl-[acyl-carrier-protein] synthase II